MQHSRLVAAVSSGLVLAVAAFGYTSNGWFGYAASAQEPCGIFPDAGHRSANAQSTAGGGVGAGSGTGGDSGGGGSGGYGTSGGGAGGGYGTSGGNPLPPPGTSGEDCEGGFLYALYEYVYRVADKTGDLFDEVFTLPPP